MNKFYSLLIISLIAAVSIVGCSKEKNNLVVAPEGGIHAAGYADPSSPDFHGKGIAAHNWSMDYCKQCHGNDFKGGNGARAAMTAILQVRHHARFATATVKILSIRRRL